MKTLSDKEIADNAKNELLKVQKEIEEVYELYSDWNPKEHWHNTLNKLRIKEHILKKILYYDK